MPFFDRKCGECGAVQVDCFEPSDAPIVLCLECGEPTERVWLTKPANVIGDECDFIRHNGTKVPFRVTSKSEDRRWLKEHGFRIKDDHIGSDGTDKNKFTTRLATMDPVTMANATELVSRASKPRWRDPDDAPMGISSDDGVLRYLRDRSRTERGEYL